MADQQPGSVGNRPPTPLWVKAIAAVGLLVVVILIVGLVLGVSHGPGMHGG